MADFAFVTQAADDVLSCWGMARTIGGNTIASLVADGAAYWRHDLADGSHLALIRLFSPVVRREEVFLGNVLLNDFLSKALLRSVEQKDLGRMALLANDLENYYYLYHGRAALEELAKAFQQEMLDSLLDLYFGNEDLARGIYGDLGRMLTFYKSNIEPFPAFAVPRPLLPELLGRVNEKLRQLVNDRETNINVILAILSFFYAKDGAEMQSFFAFLRRAMNDGLLPADAMRAVFALGAGEDFDKDVFTERKKGQVIDRVQLQEAIAGFLSNVEQQLAQGQAENLAANLAGKMPALSLVQAADVLAQGVQLGFLPLDKMGERPDLKERLPCRFCGTDAAIIVEKNIIGGFGAGRFYNQSPKLRPFEEALCGRCGISSYLVTKLLGMHIARPQPKGKDYPVPKQYNLVFHYGHHDEAGAQRLAAMIDDLFDLIGSFRRRAQEEKRFFSVEYIREELTRRAQERQEAGKAPRSEEEALAALFADDAVLPGLETLGQMRTDVQAQVLPIGVGQYRLLAFILPQLQPGRDEALDFVQRRFSRSRLAVFTLLALLRKLCSCDGPYYFQSVPTLAPGGVDSNTFYVQGKAENADEALRRYSAIVNFARRVARWREGHSLLADWILLAERLEKDPLGMFSEVLRDSPLRGGDDSQGARYKRLSNEFIKGMGVIDGIEYLKLIERLKQS
ncbi:MAG: hypothetical protein H5T68_10105 [Chloroflexi bacterium]|nr:hypothetical protein [Chloroflexota bacterium]